MMGSAFGRRASRCPPRPLRATRRARPPERWGSADALSRGEPLHHAPHGACGTISQRLFGNCSSCPVAGGDKPTPAGTQLPLSNLAGRAGVASRPIRGLRPPPDPAPPCRPGIPKQALRAEGRERPAYPGSDRVPVRLLSPSGLLPSTDSRPPPPDRCPKPRP